MGGSRRPLDARRRLRSRLTASLPKFQLRCLLLSLTRSGGLQTAVVFCGRFGKRPSLASTLHHSTAYTLRPASDSEISLSSRFFLVSSLFALITHQVTSLR